MFSRIHPASTITMLSLRDTSITLFILSSDKIITSLLSIDSCPATTPVPPLYGIRPTFSALQSFTIKETCFVELGKTIIVPKPSNRPLGSSK